MHTYMFAIFEIQMQPGSWSTFQTSFYDCMYECAPNIEFYAV